MTPEPFRVGDDVTWHDPDEGKCSRSGVLTAFLPVGDDEAASIEIDRNWCAEVLISELENTNHKTRDVVCPHCGSRRDPGWSRSEPMGYYCVDCGKDVDAQVRCTIKNGKVPIPYPEDSSEFFKHAQVDWEAWVREQRPNPIVYTYYWVIDAIQSLFRR